MGRRLSQFDRWPTGAKLLLMLSAALLPLGLALAWAARGSVEEANAANHAAAEQQGRAAVRAIESLLARNALALRIAANGAFRQRSGDLCDATAQSLTLTPAIANRFVIRRPDGSLLCSHGDIVPRYNSRLVAPGDIRLWISPQDRMVDYRVGVMGGIATGELRAEEIRAEMHDAVGEVLEASISDGENDLRIVDDPQSHDSDPQASQRRYRIGGGQLTVRTVTEVGRTTIFDQATMLLPLLMWLVAALLSWLLVRRLLIQPLHRLKSAVIQYQPGEEPLDLPDRLGPTAEIRELGQAFERAVDRIERSEREMADALEGQRRLVREVHHRVKNN